MKTPIEQAIEAMEAVKEYIGKDQYYTWSDLRARLTKLTQR